MIIFQLQNYWVVLFFSCLDQLEVVASIVIDLNLSLYFTLQALSKLRTVDWMPYVVFIKPTDAETLKQMNQQAVNDGVETQPKTVSFIFRSLLFVIIESYLLFEIS